MIPKHTSLLISALLGFLCFPGAARAAAAQTNASPAITNVPPTVVVTNAPGWLTRPLSLVEAVNLALRQNSAILKAKNDLEASHGVVMQTRAVAFPKARVQGEYANTDALESFPGSSFSFGSEHRWNVSFRLVQSLFEGGKIRAALRTARLTKEQAMLTYQRVVADTVTDVRVGYYDVLSAERQIEVQEASVNLLTRQYEDTARRVEVGTRNPFEALRAEVELANARPRLIRARNAYRVAKANLANLLGYDLPKEIWENIPMTLSDPLTAEPYDIELPVALSKALELRPELGILRKAEGIRKEAIATARSGYLPSLQGYAGYGTTKSRFTESLTDEFHGYEVGAQLVWDIWDGNLTRGKVREARALHEKAGNELDDTARRIELEVRTSYSTFVEAKEVLQSQQKVVQQAEEALRLAHSRYAVGAQTQLDVLSAQTALTEARSTVVQALREYSVARARLERAIGLGVSLEVPVPPK